MKIEKILISGPMAKEFEQGVGRDDTRAYRFAKDEDVTQEMINWADAYVTFRPNHNIDLSRMKWLHSLGAGVDAFLHKRNVGKGTIITRTTGSFGQKIAEYCLSYVLRDVQHHQYFYRSQRQKRWEPISPKALANTVILIFGTGAIGSKVAHTFSGFEASVYGVSRTGAQKSDFQNVFAIDELEASPLALDIVSSADWIISTLPLTKDTEGLFEQRLFSHCANASFINVGRGQVVNEQALLEALHENHLQQCILDVFSIEPLSAASPLWDNPQVTITPHVSALTEPEEAIDCFVQTLHAVEAGQKNIRNQVDLQSGY